MGLIKTRPDITLYAPQVVTVGQSFTARVVLTCSEPVPVDDLILEMVGGGVWYTTSQHGRHRHELDVVRLVGRPLTERKELEAGEHEFRVNFVVPEHAPPTYDGGHLSIAWHFKVRVDIPWWPDAKATFVAHVAPVPQSEPPAEPRVFASDTEGPKSTKPYAEVSLGDVISGGVLEGTIALSNVAHNDYQAIEFTLISSESVPGLFGSWAQDHKRQVWRIPLSSPKENDPVRFRIDMPPMIPAFETRQLSLKWMLEIRLRLAWAIDARLWVPLKVRALTSDERTETVAPLAVGSDRLAQIWTQAGRKSGFNYRDGELSRDMGVARLVVRREHRGRRGLALVAEARYPDLDLGLEADDGRIRCRDARQADVLASYTDDKLEGLKLEELTDERLVCVVDDPGSRLKSVAETAERLAGLWQAFEDARVELPAPADMAEALPAFQAAARRLGGDLDAASMDIRGSRHEIPFALEIQWDDDVLARTVLEVEPALPIDGRWHQAWNGTGEMEPLPEGLESLVEGARSLRVYADRIRLVFPPCGTDVGEMVERLEGLLEVARRLSGHGPGYR